MSSDEPCWVCTACTYSSNASAAVACEICEQKRPVEPGHIRVHVVHDEPGSLSVANGSPINQPEFSFCIGCGTKLLARFCGKCGRDSDIAIPVASAAIAPVNSLSPSPEATGQVAPIAQISSVVNAPAPPSINPPMVQNVQSTDTPAQSFVVPSPMPMLPPLVPPRPVTVSLLPTTVPSPLDSTRQESSPILKTVEQSVSAPQSPSEDAVRLKVEAPREDVREDVARLKVEASPPTASCEAEAEEGFWDLFSRIGLLEKLLAAGSLGTLIYGTVCNSRFAKRLYYNSGTQGYGSRSSDLKADTLYYSDSDLTELGLDKINAQPLYHLGIAMLCILTWFLYGVGIWITFQRKRHAIAKDGCKNRLYQALGLFCSLIAFLMSSVWSVMSPAITVSGSYTVREVVGQLALAAAGLGAIIGLLLPFLISVCFKKGEKYSCFCYSGYPYENIKALLFTSAGTVVISLFIYIAQNFREFVVVQLMALHLSEVSARLLIMIFFG